jgi:hypothetical protein
VSTGFNPQAGVGLSEQTIEQIRRQINRLFEEVAALSEQDLPPASYYAEFLQRSLTGIAAPAGAVWVRNPQGHLQLQYQINMREVGLDKEESRQSHDELLRQTVMSGRPIIQPPHSSSGAGENGQAAPGNPTDFVILLAPILIDKQAAGLVEVWQDRRHNPDAMPGFLQFLVRMATLAAVYLRNSQLRQMVGQQQVWTQLEAFARQVHNSLNPTEVSYIVANEGRRLVECDRVSVAVRTGRKFTIEAISGADVVEKRSNLVQLMRKLVEEVVKWGERLVYSGSKDDTLPPGVLESLDNYLAESTSKLLVVLPLHDDREGEDQKKPARSVIVMESFEPPAASEQMIARLEVVGRHATSALYNSVEHKRIPLRFLWLPLAKVQEGLGGKTRAIIYGVSAAVVLLLLVLIFVPYPLKMDAKGQLLPEERRYLYSPAPGHIVAFAAGLEPGSPVGVNQDMIEMFDVDLQKQLLDLEGQIREDNAAIEALAGLAAKANDAAERARLGSEREQKQAELIGKRAQLEAKMARVNAVQGQPGFFWLKSPISGTVLTSDFREQLTNKYVKPTDQLLRIGDKDMSWEIELKIPQKHIGQILRAYTKGQTELDVDILLSTVPTQTFRGKLARNKIGGEAAPNRDENNESEPVVLAYVRIDGPGISESQRVPRNELVAGTEVHAKVRCGNRAMGYSLLYGVWEFIYEKIIFWF